MCKENLLTCVYCGKEYPPGTPNHGVSLLTDHVKQCEKHPMRKLREALVGLIGVDGKEDLGRMERAVRVSPAAEKDKTVMLKSIHALIDTL